MTDELDKALFDADWINKQDIGELTIQRMARVLAAAVRSLRETVKTQDEEIARLKLSWDSAEAQIDDVDDELRDVVKENAALRKKLHEAGINPSLDEALNSGDRRDKL